MHVTLIIVKFFPCFQGWTKETNERKRIIPSNIHWSKQVQQLSFLPHTKKENQGKREHWCSNQNDTYRTGVSSQQYQFFLHFPPLLLTSSIIVNGSIPAPLLLAAGRGILGKWKYHFLAARLHRYFCSKKGKRAKTFAQNGKGRAIWLAGQFI